MKTAEFDLPGAEKFAKSSDKGKMKGSKVFRLSVTNFRPKKTADADLFTNPFGNSLTRTPMTKANTSDSKREFYIMGQQPKLELSTKPRPMTQTQAGFNPRQAALKFVRVGQPIESKSDSTTPMPQGTKAEVISVRAPLGSYFQRCGTSQKNMIKIPISDLYNVPTVKSSRTSGANNYGLIDLENGELKLPGKMSLKNISLEQIDEDEPNDAEKFKKINNQSTMDCSSQLTRNKTISNFSTSSYQAIGNNHEFDRNAKLTNKVTQKEELAMNSPDKFSKTSARFFVAKEKAKIYNDQMIKQYQFDRENEEEEHDFVELCELLQSNIKV